MKYSQKNKIDLKNSRSILLRSNNSSLNSYIGPRSLVSRILVTRSLVSRSLINRAQGDYTKK